MNELNIKRIGYKGFDVNEKGELYCRDMVFHVGETAEVKGALEICKNGIHFCWNINDVNEHYTLRDHVICEVEPLGDVIASDDGKKCCTNLIKIVKMLTAEEVLRLSNSGRENTGYINSGNRNSGDRNSGDWNSGFFNENENKCFIFDKISDFTVREFVDSKYHDALTSAPFVLTKWIEYSEEEKSADKSKALIGGYLKTYDYKEACANWWANMTEENKKLVQEIPNFDAEKFYRITGIRVEAIDNGTI